MQYTHALIYKLQGMRHKVRLTKHFSSVWSQRDYRSHSILSLNFFLKKKTLWRQMESNHLIGMWNFSFTTSCPQYLRRVSNCYLPTLIFNDNLHKDIHREKRLTPWVLRDDDCNLLFLTEGFSLLGLRYPWIQYTKRQEQDPRGSTGCKS